MMVFPFLLVLVFGIMAPSLVAAWGVWWLGFALERVVHPLFRAHIETTTSDPDAHLRSAPRRPMIIAGIPGALALPGLMPSMAIALPSTCEKGSSE